MKKILFLEDEIILGQIYQKILKKAGFKVVWITKPQEAKNQLKKFNPDIAILDLIIKNTSQNGLKLVSEIKKTIPQTKIIILSNYSHQRVQKKAFKAGADDYLIKINTHPNVLIEYINKILQ